MYKYLLEWCLLIITANINLLLYFTYLKNFIGTMDKIQNMKKRKCNITISRVHSSPPILVFSNDLYRNHSMFYSQELKKYMSISKQKI